MKNQILMITKKMENDKKLNDDTKGKNITSQEVNTQKNNNNTKK